LINQLFKLKTEASALDRFETFTVTILKISKLIRQIKLFEMEDFDLKAVHVMCIYFTGKHQTPVTAAELVKLTSEDKAAISRALAMLHKKGFINYDAKTYNAPITFTESGYKLFERIEKKADDAVKAGGGFMSDEERVQLYALLAKISGNLENYYKDITNEK
jgi:DNA-binding MarR family transcriptional regulator